MLTFRTPSSHPPWMTQARLAQRQPRKLAVKINVRASAAECDFLHAPEIAPTKTPSLNMTLLRCTQTFLEIRPCRARPGRAKPSQAGQGRRLGPAPGQPLDLASFRKTVDSFTRNAHFRAGPPKLMVSTTRNDYFQNSIHTSALDDLSPDDPTAPHIFPSGKKRHASAAKCVVISTTKKKQRKCPY